MLLVVDVGNTQTHFGLFRDGETNVSQHWRRRPRRGLEVFHPLVESYPAPVSEPSI